MPYSHCEDPRLFQRATLFTVTTVFTNMWSLKAESQFLNLMVIVTTSNPIFWSTKQRQKTWKEALNFTFEANIFDS